MGVDPANHARSFKVTQLKQLAFFGLLLFGLLAQPIPGISTAWAQQLSKEVKPYDKRLARLAEILGAVHYLRELCQSGDNQLWRDHMQKLIRAEGTSALRRARLTRSFNQGYRSYQRTYNVCTPSAKTTIERFLTEGVRIGEDLFKAFPK